MTVRHLFSAWVGTAMLAAFASNAAEQRSIESDDPVAASFARELAHEAPEARKVTRGDIDSDQLYKQVNAALQTPEHNQTIDKGSDHE